MIAIGARALPRDARRLPRDGRALPHRAVRAEPARAARSDRHLVRRLLRRRDPGDPAVQPVPRALHRVPPAARHGEQRQVGRRSTATRSRADRADRLGPAGHERAARLLPAHPPGHEAHPVRLHRLRRTPNHESATTTTCSWRTSSPRPRRSRSARRRTRSRPRACPPRWCRTARSAGNHPTNTILAREAHAARARPARRAVRAQGVHAGRDLEHQLVRPVGRRARQGAGQPDRAASSTGATSRAGARQLDQRADPPLPPRCAADPRHRSRRVTVPVLCGGSRASFCSWWQELRSRSSFSRTGPVRRSTTATRSVSARSSRSTRRLSARSSPRRLTAQLVQAGNQQATSFRPTFELALEGVIDGDTFKSIFRNAVRHTHESIIEQGDGGGRQGLDLGASFALITAVSRPEGAGISRARAVSTTASATSRARSTTSACGTPRAS